VVVAKCIADDTALTTGNGKAHFTVPIELNGIKNERISAGGFALRQSLLSAGI